MTGAHAPRICRLTHGDRRRLLGGFVQVLAHLLHSLARLLRQPDRLLAGFRYGFCVEEINKRGSLDGSDSHRGMGNRYSEWAQKTPRDNVLLSSQVRSLLSMGFPQLRQLSLSPMLSQTSGKSDFSASIISQAKFMSGPRHV